MKTERQKRALEVQDSIRQILFKEWDPLDVNEFSTCDDEYDSFIARIYRILVGNGSEEELVKCLFDSSEELNVYEVSRKENPNKYKESLKAIARKLLEVDVSIQSR